MTNPRKLLLALATLIMLAGCATAPDEQRYPAGRASSQTDDKATVYVFRRYAEPLAIGATISISGRQIANLQQAMLLTPNDGQYPRQGTYTWAHVSPGKHTIEANWSFLSGQKTRPLPVELKAGETYYFELVGKMEISLWSILTPVIFGFPNSDLIKRNAIAAELALVQCCRYRKARAD